MIEINKGTSVCQIIKINCNTCKRIFKKKGEIRSIVFKKKEMECLIAKDNTGEFATLLFKKRNKQESNQCNLILFLKTKNSGFHLF